MRPSHFHEKMLKKSPSVRKPGGGGVEYLHRDPASRRSDEKGSQIWDSKIWSRVPRD
jgi:hypothetical protein